MSAESGGLAEAFAADFADEWACSGVDWHVAGEIVVGVEHLPTLGAGEGFLLGQGCGRCWVVRVCRVG